MKLYKSTAHPLGDGYGEFYYSASDTGGDVCFVLAATIRNGLPFDIHGPAVHHDSDSDLESIYAYLQVPMMESVSRDATPPAVVRLAEKTSMTLIRTWNRAYVANDFFQTLRQEALQPPSPGYLIRKDTFSSLLPLSLVAVTGFVVLASRFGYF